MRRAEALIWLIQHGADIMLLKRDGWRDTALHYAAARGQLGAVQVLLAAGADPKAGNYAGELPVTPLRHVYSPAVVVA